MKVLKILATIGVLSPVIWIMGVIGSVVLFLLRHGLSDSEGMKRSFLLAIVFFYTGIATLVLFLVGCALLVFHAYRKGK